MTKNDKVATGTELAKETQGAIAMPDFMDAADFGGGFEGTDKDAYAIPFIQVLQKMSPMVDPDDPKYVEGAKAGMFYNTVTGKLYDGKEGLTIIPCYYKRSYIQWGGREADGGFKGEFSPEQIADMVDKGEIVALDGKLFKPMADGSVQEKKSDYFADTRSHFSIIVDNATGETGQAIISLAASQVKASKMLMTSLQQKKVDTPAGKRTPPTYANKVKATTVGQSNDKGTWSGIKFELEGLVTDKNLYEEAKSFYSAIAAGELKADYSKADHQTAAAESSASGAAEADNF